MGKLDSVLKWAVNNSKPSNDEFGTIKTEVESFIKKLKEKIKDKGLALEIFLGGSYAKGTLVKKDVYDIDIFVKVNKGEDISQELEKAISDFPYEKIHGSRDYFRIKAKDNLCFELVPVKKIKRPEEAENTTDLSYLHVDYVNKKANGQMKEEIVLAKAFCIAQQCYGAESYIRGFSGYSLELLIIHYKSFLNFIKKASKIKEKEVIDMEKHYRTKKLALLDINESKLGSPIILVDPTFKQRNALAALSDVTFKKFQKAAIKFIKNPKNEFFEMKKTDLAKIKEIAGKKGNEFVLIEAETERQPGDIAGSKLFKFYNFIEGKLTRYFDIRDKGFNYNKKQSGRYYFVVKSKEKIIVDGPSLQDPKNLLRFRAKHKNIFTKSGKIFAKETIKFSAKEFLEKWKKENSRQTAEMGIVKIKILD